MIPSRSLHHCSFVGQLRRPSEQVLHFTQKSLSWATNCGTRRRAAELAYCRQSYRPLSKTSPKSWEHFFPTLSDQGRRANRGGRGHQGWYAGSRFASAGARLVRQLRSESAHGNRQRRRLLYPCLRAHGSFYAFVRGQHRAALPWAFSGAADSRFWSSQTHSSGGVTGSRRLYAPTRWPRSTTCMLRPPPAKIRAYDRHRK